MKNLQAKLNLRYEPDYFLSLKNAKSYAARSTKPMLVMQGEYPYYMTVVFCDTAKLEKAGFETVR